MTNKSRLSIAIAAVTLAIIGGTAVYALDKYSLKTPDGIAFADFKGYAADGDTCCSTMTPRPISSPPIRALRIVGTHAMWP
jgi:hypothetical protein